MAGLDKRLADGDIWKRGGVVNVVVDEEDPDNDKVDMTGEDADTLDSTGMEGATPTGGGVRGVFETLVCMVGDAGSVCLLMAIRRG